MRIRCLNTLFIGREDLNEHKVGQKQGYWIKMAPTFVIEIIIIDKDISRDELRASEVYPAVIKIKKLHKSKLIYEQKTRKEKSKPKTRRR
jgi:hypothetical protein